MISEATKIGELTYLTKAQKFSIEFATRLEENEESMPEQAAIAVTCEQFGVDYEDYAPIMFDLPDGNWWEYADLPVKS